MNISTQSITPDSLVNYGQLEEIKFAENNLKRYSDVFAKTLLDLGAKVAFGIPGGAISSIYDSMAKILPKVVLTQHESGGAYLGIGYKNFNKASDIPICFATAGPGATNLITGVACAYSEKIPLFVVTGNISTENNLKGALQDSTDTGVDVARMFESITAKSMTLKSSNQIAPVTKYLYELAQSTRLPVHLSIPINIASEKLD